MYLYDRRGRRKKEKGDSFRNTNVTATNVYGIYERLERFDWNAVARLRERVNERTKTLNIQVDDR